MCFLPSRFFEWYHSVKSFKLICPTAPVCLFSTDSAYGDTPGNKKFWMLSGGRADGLNEEVVHSSVSTPFFEEEEEEEVVEEEKEG